MSSFFTFFLFLQFLANFLFPAKNLILWISSLASTKLHTTQYLSSSLAISSNFSWADFSLCFGTFFILFSKILSDYSYQFSRFSQVCKIFVCFHFGLQPIRAKHDSLSNQISRLWRTDLTILRYLEWSVNSIFGE